MLPGYLPAHKPTGCRVIRWVESAQGSPLNALQETAFSRNYLQTGLPGPGTSVNRYSPGRFG